MPGGRKPDPNSLTNRIIQACAVPRGLDMPAIYAATQGSRATIGVMVPQLAGQGRLYRAGRRKMYRYFANAADALAYSQVFEQEFKAATAERIKRTRQRYEEKRAKARAPVKPKTSKPAKAKSGRKPKHGPTITVSTSKAKAKAEAQPSIAAATTVTYPKNYKKTVREMPEDTRFTFTPPPGWKGELMQDWQQRRSA